MNIIQRTLSGILLLAGLAWQPAATAQNEAKPSAERSICARTGRLGTAGRARHAVHRKRRRHLPRLPRRGGRLGDVQHGGHLQGPACAPRRCTCAVRRRRSAVRGLPRPGRPALGQGRQQQPRRSARINSLKADSYPARRAAQRALPGLPPGQLAHRLACGRTRSRRARLHRLPQAARRARCRARQEQRTGGLLPLPQAAARRLPQVVLAPGALWSHGVQRLPQPARIEQRGDAGQADGEPDLLHLPRRQARSAALGACAGGRGLHAVPLEPRFGAHGAAEQDAAAAVPAMPLGGGPPVGGAHGGRWRLRIFLLAGSCTNCHSQVHGSNHPAGAKLMR